MRVDGLEVDVTGSGSPALLLLHPGVTDRTFWDPVWPALAERHRVVRYDHRAFGASDDPQGPWAPAEDAHTVLDAIGIERAVVIGVSFGSDVALNLALAHPRRVAGVVVVSGPTLPDDALEAEWDAVGEELDRGDLDAANAREVALWVIGSGREAADVDPDLLAWATEQNRALLGRQPQIEHEPEMLEPGKAIEQATAVRVPALAICGEHDQPASLAGARAAAEALRTELVVVPGAAHLVGRERPDAFLEVLAGWLPSVAATASPA